jgi:hypothetical protein
LADWLDKISAKGLAKPYLKTNGESVKAINWIIQKLPNE